MNEQREEARKSVAEPQSGRTLMMKECVFYRERIAEMIRYAIQIGLSPEQAKEIVQIAWRKFFEQGPALSAENAADCRAWLWHVARNEVVSLFRNLSQQPEQWPRDPQEELANPSAIESAAHEVLSRQSESFRSWLVELGAKNPLRRDLVFARHILGERPADLAKKHGKTPHWISKQINLALNDFRVWLTRHGYVVEEDA